MIRRCWSVFACWVVLAACRPAAAQVIITILPDTGLASNQAAIAAFNRAAQQWSSRFSNPVTIMIGGDLRPLAAGVIASTTPNDVTQTYSQVRSALIADAATHPSKAIVNSLPATYAAVLPTGYTLTTDSVLTQANAKALGFSVGAGPAGFIALNSNIPYDFDNSNGVTPGTIDFETAAAHEIGHILGFASAVDTVDSTPSGAISARPLDYYRFHNVAGQVPTDGATFSTLPRDLTPGDAAVFSDAALGNLLSTGAIHGDGNQASHWKDDAITGQYIGIMDPTLPSGVVEPITAADVRAFELIGWDLTPVPEPSTLALVTLAAVGLAIRRTSRRKIEVIGAFTMSD